MSIGKDLTERNSAHLGHPRLRIQSGYSATTCFLTATMSKSALIIGATGQVGRHALNELLASSHFSTVGEFGRRVTDPATLKTGKDKLQQKTIDFDNLDEPALKEGKWDIVFVT